METDSSTKMLASPPLSVLVNKIPGNESRSGKLINFFSDSSADGHKGTEFCQRSLSCHQNC